MTGTMNTEITISKTIKSNASRIGVGDIEIPNGNAGKSIDYTPVRAFRERLWSGE